MMPPAQAVHAPRAQPDPASAHLRECPHCGRFQRVHAVAPGRSADCLRCGTILRRGRADTLNRALALNLTVLCLLVLAVILPFLGLRVVGRSYEATMFTGPMSLCTHGLWELGILVALTSIVMPFVKVGLILTVLLGLRSARPSPMLPRLFAWYDTLRPWAMLEVFLLGTFVAFSRLEALATVVVGPALYAVGGCVLALAAADSSLDHEAVWEEIDRRGLRGPALGGSHRIGCPCCGLVSQAEPGQRCPRCRTALTLRQPRSLALTWSLVFAAALMYLPANLLPVMVITRYGRSQDDTILGGVKMLVDAQLWPLAALVFFASIMVPGLKLLALGWMMASTQWRSRRALVFRVRLYRVVEFIGRWSMIDIFLLSALVALVQMGFLATVQPEMGDLFFGAVVILTMFAARTFDPRLMWDHAGLCGADFPAEVVIDSARMSPDSPVAGRSAVSGATPA